MDFEYFRRKNSLNIDYLDIFEQETQQFISDETKKFIPNLNNDIHISFANFNDVYDSDLWIKIFQYLLKKIIQKEDTKKYFLC